MARGACRARRVREAVKSINSLAFSAGAKLAPESSTAEAPTATQSSVLARLGRRVSRYPADPVSRSDREALFALLKTHDFYQVDTHLREPLDEKRLNLL